MKPAIAWIVFLIVVAVLYVADLKHLAASRYNFFLLLLIGLVIVLIASVKICYRDSQQNIREP